MRFCVTVFLFAVLFGSGPISGADQGDLGVGLVVGIPTALTGKLRMIEDRAIDFGLSWDFGDYVLFYGDYLFEYPYALDEHRKSEMIFPYWGVGLTLIFLDDKKKPPRPYSRDKDESFQIGVRIPLGLAWIPRSTPLEVFLELIPGVSLFPGLSGNFGVGLGVRYFF